MEDIKRLAAASAVVSDIDGVLLVNGTIVGGVTQLAQQKRLALVSNNSTHSAQELCQLFLDAGVSVKPEQFFLAGEAAVKQLAHDLHKGKLQSATPPRVLALSTEAIHHMLRHEGLELVSPTDWRQADAVLVCRDTSITYARLEAAANAARAGVPVYCANPDLSHPAEEGLHLETGAFLALLQAVVPSMKPIILGKPLPDLLLNAVRYLDIDVDKAIFLGDNLMTDAPCAMAAGMPFIHVNAVCGPSLMDLGFCNP